MKKSCKLLQLLLVFLLIFTATACSSKKSNSEQSKGVFVFARGGDAVSLDPSQVTDSESENVSQSILETLVTFEEGKTNVVPLLATKWTVSNNGLTYIFKLRKGVKFQDGTDFNADAVVYNFNRWMAAKDHNKFYMYGSVFGGFHGDKNHAIEEVQTVDSHTVKFKLKYPKPTFLKDLALTPFSISSPAAIKKENDKYGSHPVGTGPFIFKEWKRGDRIVLSKNKNYWLSGYPKLDQVIFRTIKENSARLNALRSGEVDMVDGLDSGNIEQIKNNKDFQILTRPPLNIGYLGFNVKRKPFDNKWVRQALNYAVDKKAMIKTFFADQAIPAKNPIPPTIEGYNNEVDAYPFDPDKAKALLNKAGYPDGFQMELWAMPVSRPYMPDADKVAEYLQSSFEKIGVKAKIVTYEWGSYLDKVKQGEADAFLLGWTGANGDADDFIYTLWHGKNIGSMNSTFYDNKELNALLDEARTTMDQKKRKEFYQRAQEIMHEDAPILPLVHTTPVLAARADITGFDPHPTGRVITTRIEFQ